MYLAEVRRRPWVLCVVCYAFTIHGEERGGEKGGERERARLLLGQERGSSTSVTSVSYIV